jgi:hypothetical protein
MEPRFRMLQFFAGVQIFLGMLSLGAAVVVLLFLALTIASSQPDERAPALVIAGVPAVLLALGLAVGGLTLVAQGQFLQVVAQIEINTRLAVAAPPATKADSLPPLKPLEPRAIQQLFTTTGDSG